MNTQSKIENTPQVGSRSTHRMRASLGTVAVLVSLALSGCASTSPAYHKFAMQGQVLSVDGNSLVVCVGKEDGAKVGQELSIVRHVNRPASSKVPGPGFRREAVGKVRIDSIFDEHYSRAQVLSGSPQVNDTVELDR